MFLKSIIVENIRNLQKAHLHFHPKVNVFIGPNGSGKTSILESLYFLSVGRSFRASKSINLINTSQHTSTIVGSYTDLELMQDLKVGIFQNKDREKIIKIGGNLVSMSEVAALSPVQIINSEIGNLVFHDPEGRRKFLDWLVFYSHNNYGQLWRDFNRSLQQRNRLLKQPPKDCINVLNNLDKVFCELSLRISSARQKAWQCFQEFWQPLFFAMKLNPQIAPSIYFDQGWSGELCTKLLQNRDNDLRQKSTGYGPHKADLRIFIDNKSAKDLLSKGQGKTLSLALTLARAKFLAQLAQRTDTTSILLIDDLSSELDDVNLQQIINLIMELIPTVQVFLAGTDRSKLLTHIPIDCYKLFIVNDGKVEAVQHCVQKGGSLLVT